MADPIHTTAIGAFLRNAEAPTSNPVAVTTDIPREVSFRW